MITSLILSSILFLTTVTPCPCPCVKKHTPTATKSSVSRVYAPHRVSKPTPKPPCPPCRDSVITRVLFRPIRLVVHDTVTVEKYTPGPNRLIEKITVLTPSIATTQWFGISGNNADRNGERNFPSAELGFRKINLGFRAGIAGYPDFRRVSLDGLIFPSSPYWYLGGGLVVDNWSETKTVRSDSVTVYVCSSKKPVKNRITKYTRYKDDQFLARPSLFLGAQTKGQFALFLEGREIFSPRGRRNEAVGTGGVRVLF